MKLAKIVGFLRCRADLVACIAVAILTIPAFASLLNPSYFYHHDNQHIVRLYLLGRAFAEGDIYPRWVDGLGFGFGYPLFNFYPPMIYYLALVFHAIGFSLVGAIKAVIVTGFLAAALGMYFLTRVLYGRLAAIAASTLYTYFFYHGVTVYVRGAFAEFFTMAVLPFVLLTVYLLYKRLSVGLILASATAFAILVVTHPLIAFPAVLYSGAFGIFLFLRKLKRDRWKYLAVLVFTGVLSLSISAFFWLPSMRERQYTLVDRVFSKELGDFRIHFVQPEQLWVSNWGYGGSGAGIENDGMTFQLGKIHTALAVITLMALAAVFGSGLRVSDSWALAAFSQSALGVTILLMLDVSRPVWEAFSYLQYLQFPWRLLTFAAVFISISGGAAVYSIEQASRYLGNNIVQRAAAMFVVVIICATVVLYGRYFKPKEYVTAAEAELTSYDEITWRVSRSSFEFVPAGVSTRVSDLGTTVIDLDPPNRPSGPYTLVKGRALIEEVSVRASEKSFIVRAGQPVTFRLNTFSFPGWTARLINPINNEATSLEINDDNPLRLMTVDLPEGEYFLTFTFEKTPVRVMGELLTAAALVLAVVLYLQRRKINPLLSRSN